jgi:hypothetical protein
MVYNEGRPSHPATTCNFSHLAVPLDEGVDDVTVTLVIYLPLAAVHGCTAQLQRIDFA